MVTDQQFRRLMKLSKTQQTLASAASKAGMDEKTARKYRRIGRPPSQLKLPRAYRTRVDIFRDVWPEVEQFLQQDASVEAVTIFEHLCRKYEGQFKPSQVRTLQRHVKLWRARYGAPREVFFPQQHVPGRQAQSDFTHMAELGVQLGGQPFDHLFYHFTLTYSNWEAGTVCFSESFESLSAGLQNALWELGGVPQEHRTDSLSAAVNLIGNRDEFTARYQGLLDHYRMRATHSSPRRAHENGDVEQSHYRFKRAVAQQLVLRGSRNFASRAEYAAFLRGLCQRRNAGRRERLHEELAVMHALPAQRLEDYTPETIKVTRNSTVVVRNNFYSVPSQLIGERVEVRRYAEHLEVWYGGRFVQQMARLRGEGKHQINYRHVIHSLVKKPGAFAHYRYQQSLFPRLLFRVAYDLLCEHYASTADRQYVKLLQLAAEESEERVEAAVRQMVERGELVTYQRVRELVAAPDQRAPLTTHLVEVCGVELASYDALLVQPASKEVPEQWIQ